MNCRTGEISELINEIERWKDDGDRVLYLPNLEPRTEREREDRETRLARRREQGQIERRLQELQHNALNPQTVREK